NSFLWDGRNDSGEEVGKGKYSIKVEAQYEVLGAKGKLHQVPIEASTSLRATVVSVELKGDKAQLVLDNKVRIDPSQVREILGKDTTSDSEAVSNIPDYISYLGKKAEVTLERMNMSASGADVRFIADKDVTRIKMHVYDESGKRIQGVAEIEGEFSQGYNSFAWDGKAASSFEEFANAREKKISLDKLPEGKYKYEIYAVEKDNKGKEQLRKFANSKEITITSVDGSFVFEGIEKYDVWQISKVKNVAEIETTPISEAFQYIGKMVSFDDNMLDLKDGEVTIYASLDDPPAGFTLGDLTMNVYNSKALVGTVNVSAADAYYMTEVPVPIYDDLNIASQAKVNAFLDKAFSPRDDTNPDQIRQKAAYIEQEFRKGNLVTTIFDTLSADGKQAMLLKNQGLVRVKWDGKDANGLQLDDGKYRYEIITRTVRTADNSINAESLNLEKSVLVTGTHMIGDSFELELQSGEVIKPEAVKSVGILRR
ncbi:MAG: hypothetical protein V4485_05315, partial [Pseudomonadota bacterium]